MNERIHQLLNKLRPADIDILKAILSNDEGMIMHILSKGYDKERLSQLLAFFKSLRPEERQILQSIIMGGQQGLVSLSTTTEIGSVKHRIRLLGGEQLDTMQKQLIDNDGIVEETTELAQLSCKHVASEDKPVRVSDRFGFNVCKDCVRVCSYDGHECTRFEGEYTFRGQYFCYDHLPFYCFVARWKVRRYMKKQGAKNVK